MDVHSPRQWDIGQFNADRIGAVAAFGLADRQARFLVTVMLHSGVFVGRQYAAFAGISHGQKVHDFVERLVAKRLGTATTLGAQQRARVFHVHHKPLYAAIGERDNRHRKPVAIERAIERLMILDAVIADPQTSWLGTEREKRRHFIERLGTRLEDHEYPRLVFGTPPNTTVRYFADKFPIGVQPEGRGHVFFYLPTSDTPMDFRMFLLRHAELFHALGRWTIRTLFPRPSRSLINTFEAAALDQLAKPLRVSDVDELRWVFSSVKPRHRTQQMLTQLAWLRRQEHFGPLDFRLSIGAGSRPVIALSGWRSRRHFWMPLSAVTPVSKASHSRTPTCISPH